MAKKKTHKGTPKTFTGDRLLRFAREHTVGVLLVAVLGSLGGWLGYYVRDCLKDQKTQLAATRKAWTSDQTSDEKFTDSLTAVLTRLEIYAKDRKNSSDHLTIEQQRKAMFDVAQTVNADCNIAKSAKYDFQRELKALGRLLEFDVPDGTDLSQQCEGLARATEELRTAATPGVSTETRTTTSTNDFDSKVDSLRQIIQASKNQRKKADVAVNAMLTTFEQESIINRVKRCL